MFHIKNQITLLIFSFLFLVSSCSKDALEIKLTSKESVWYIIDYNSVDKLFENTYHAYIFKSNKICNYVFYDFSSESIVPYKNIMSDVKEYNDWNHIGEHEISIRKRKYKIVNFKNDTIILKSDNNIVKILINLRKDNPSKLPFYQMENLSNYKLDNK